MSQIRILAQFGREYYWLKLDIILKISVKISNFWVQTLVILQDLHRISFHAVGIMGISRRLRTENYTSKVVIIQKSLRIIANFSSMIFRAKKTVPIFPDENVSIILVSVTYKRNMKTFWHRKLYIKI